MRSVNRTLYPVLISFLTFFPSLAFSSAPVLHSNTDVATAGYFQLNWESGTATAQFQLEESPNADFSDGKVLYTGVNTASVISGKPDGDYYYRLKTIDDGTPSAWSEPVHVMVRHHDIGKAVAFFLTGLFVFLMTLFAIVRENKGNAT